MSNLVIFTAGGTVQADGGIYLTRNADRELLQLCQQGRFAYVLTARQMGKSSLMIATANALEEQDIRTAIIDLTQMGAQTTSAEEWYLGFLGILSEDLGLEDRLTDFWESHQSLSLTQRFTQFFGDIVKSGVWQKSSGVLLLG